MKKTVSFLCALTLAAIVSSPAPARGAEPRRRLKARVTKVYDGASFQLGGGLRSALIGVAAPAPGAPGSSQAHAYLKRLIENRTVSLEIDEKPVDAYGQTVYYVFLEEGGHVNVLMALRGMGRALVKPPQRALPQGVVRSGKPRQAIQPGACGETSSTRATDRPVNFIPASPVAHPNPLQPFHAGEFSYWQAQLRNRILWGLFIPAGPVTHPKSFLKNQEIHPSPIPANAPALGLLKNPALGASALDAVPPFSVGTDLIGRVKPSSCMAAVSTSPGVAAEGQTRARKERLYRRPVLSASKEALPFDALPMRPGSPSIRRASAPTRDEGGESSRVKRSFINRV